MFIYTKFLSNFWKLIKLLKLPLSVSIYPSLCQIEDVILFEVIFFFIFSTFDVGISVIKHDFTVAL